MITHCKGTARTNFAQVECRCMVSSHGTEYLRVPLRRRLQLPRLKSGKHDVFRTVALKSERAWSAIRALIQVLAAASTPGHDSRLRKLAIANAFTSRSARSGSRSEQSRPYPYSHRTLRRLIIVYLEGSSNIATRSICGLRRDKFNLNQYVDQDLCWSKFVQEPHIKGTFPDEAVQQTAYPASSFHVLVP